MPAWTIPWGQHSPQPHVLVPCSSLCLLLCSSLSSKYWATLLYHFSQEGRSRLIWLSLSFCPTRVSADYGVASDIHAPAVLQIPFSEPRICLWSVPSFAHSCEHLGGQAAVLCLSGTQVAGHGVSSALLLLSEGYTVLGPAWGPGGRGAAFLPLFIGKTVSRNQFCGAFDQSNQCS